MCWMSSSLHQLLWPDEKEAAISVETDHTQLSRAYALRGQLGDVTLPDVVFELKTVRSKEVPSADDAVLETEDGHTARPEFPWNEPRPCVKSTDRGHRCEV